MRTHRYTIQSAFAWRNHLLLLAFSRTAVLRKALFYLLTHKQVSFHQGSAIRGPRQCRTLPQGRGSSRKAAGPGEGGSAALCSDTPLLAQPGRSRRLQPLRPQRGPGQGGPGSGPGTSGVRERAPRPAPQHAPARRPRPRPAPRPLTRSRCSSCRRRCAHTEPGSSPRRAHIILPGPVSRRSENSPGSGSGSGGDLTQDASGAVARLPWRRARPFAARRPASRAPVLSGRAASQSESGERERGGATAAESAPSGEAGQ